MPEDLFNGFSWHTSNFLLNAMHFNDVFSDIDTDLANACTFYGDKIWNRRMMKERKRIQRIEKSLFWVKSFCDVRFLMSDWQIELCAWDCDFNQWINLRTYGEK